MGLSVCEWKGICYSTDVVLARFICGITMHIKLAPELQQAMNMMKYSINHSWKFDNFRIAFLSGFLQGFMVVSVEVINFINLLLRNQVMVIVMSFLSLVIVANFDDFFYSVFKNEDLKAIVQNKIYKDFLLI